ncbi:MAG: DUF3520 domain-containing protein [Acidobacteria bacterium]|nr:DUF3520 domain-containing protein [Acidobacteriota bacterium]MBV9475002.1 DUF3520 domain-containing protein [Acidobacteriota bacterium]
MTIAKDVKVQLAFDPARVASYRQIGYENRALANEDFDNDEVDAGELGAGDSVTVLYEVVPRGDARGGTLSTLKVRYKEPHAWRSRLVTAEAVDEGKSAYEASVDLQFAASVAEFGLLLRDSPNKESASYDDALHLARVSQGADLDGMRGEFLALLDKAKR